MYCDHCKKEVSKSTYYRHRAEFYNEYTQSWCPPAKFSRHEAVDLKQGEICEYII